MFAGDQITSQRKKKEMSKKQGRRTWTDGIQRCRRTRTVCTTTRLLCTGASWWDRHAFNFVARNVTHVVWTEGGSIWDSSCQPFWHDSPPQSYHQAVSPCDAHWERLQSLSVRAKKREFLLTSFCSCFVVSAKDSHWGPRAKGVFHPPPPS